MNKQPFRVGSEQVEVLVHLDPGAKPPVYASACAAGADLYAYLSQPYLIRPLERGLIPTGLRFALPSGYELQIRPRSGLALHHGVTVLNTPGTIDADYRGELGVILVNLGQEVFEVKPEMRIAQIVFASVGEMRCRPILTAQWKALGATERGEGAFGHTGV